MANRIWRPRLPAPSYTPAQPCMLLRFAFLQTSKSDSPPNCCVASRQLRAGGDDGVDDDDSPPTPDDGARRLHTSCMTRRAEAQFPTPSACSSASSLLNRNSRSSGSSARHPQRHIPNTTLRSTERATLLLPLPLPPPPLAPALPPLPAGTRRRHSIVSCTPSRISGQPGCSPDMTECR